MNILTQLTVDNLKLNRRRTIVTIIGVALSCALIVAVAGMVASFRQMMMDVSIHEYGNYHDMYENISVDQLHVIEQNKNVESFYFGRVDINDDNRWYLYYDTAIEAKEITLTDSYDDTAKLRGVFVRYKNPQEYMEVRQAIIQDMIGDSDEKIKIRTNSDLMRYEGVMGDRLLSTIVGLAAVIIVIIIVSSIFVIRNSFSISATERMRQFGMLASIGATSWQIRGLVYIEGLIIACFGIVLGCIIGVLADLILVQIVNLLLGEMFSMTEGLINKIHFVLPPIVIIIASVLTIITVLLSSRSAARKAAKMSPVDALRGMQDYKIKNKIYDSKIIHKLFGIGGVIADKNLRRSSKKYRTTVISLVVSISIFIGLASILNYGSRIISLQYANISYDIVANISSDKTLSVVREIDGIKEINIIDNLPVEELNFHVMDRDTFAKYAKSVGIIGNDYSHTIILNDYVLLENDGKRTVERYTDKREGETVEISIRGEDENGDEIIRKYDVEISKITDVQPSFVSSYMLSYYASEDYYQIDEMKEKLGVYKSTKQVLISTDAPEAVTEKIELIFEKNAEEEGSHSVYNISQEARLMRNMYLLMSIFLYGFVIVISLIGLTNIFNTITTNVALRAKEFAMLKSVGMTKQEFNRMIRLESILYSSKSLIIGVPLGIALSYVIYKAIANSFDFGYIFPLEAVIIAIVTVAILVFAIMSYSVKQVNKQNIIETIRNDNI